MKFGPYFPVFGLDTETYEVNSYRLKVDIKFFSDHFFFFFGKKKKRREEKSKKRREEQEWKVLNFIPSISFKI